MKNMKGGVMWFSRKIESKKENFGLFLKVVTMYTYWVIIKLLRIWK